MKKQGSYIIQGFLLALLIPIILVIVERVVFIQPANGSSSTLIEYEIPKTDNEGSALNGKILFLQNCAACHNIFRDGTGPSLSGLEERGPWRERKKLYEWIKNPSAFMKKNEYARDLKEKYGSLMTAFPDLSNEQIDAIVEYLK